LVETPVGDQVTGGSIVPVGVISDQVFGISTDNQVIDSIEEFNNV
jgi:hypothetical protein